MLQNCDAYLKRKVPINGSHLGKIPLREGLTALCFNAINMGGMTIISWLIAIGGFFMPFMEALSLHIKFPLKVYEVALALALIAFLVRCKMDFPKAIKISVTLLLIFWTYCMSVLLYRKFNPSIGFDPTLVFTRFSPFIDSITKMLYMMLNIVGFALFGWLAFKRPSLFLRSWLWGATVSAGYSVYLAVSSILHIPVILLPGMEDPQMFNDYIIRCGTFLEGNYAALFYLISFSLALHAKHYGKAFIIFLGLFSTFSTIGIALIFLILCLEIIRLARKMKAATKISLFVISVASIVISFSVFVSTPVGKTLLVDKLFANDNETGKNSVAYSRKDRIETALAAFQIYTVNPLLGVGISQFPYYYNFYAQTVALTLEEDRVIPNNVYVEILGETGIIGGLLFFIFLIMIFYFARYPGSYSLNIALIVILLYWLSFPTFSVMFLWSFWGGLIGLAQYHKSKLLESSQKVLTESAPKSQVKKTGFRLSEWPPLQPFKIATSFGVIFLILLGILLWQDFGPKEKAEGQIATPNVNQESFIWGINAHPTEQEVYRQISLDQQFALLKKLGVTWYRCDWADYPSYDRTDEIVDKAAAQNITVLPVLFPSVDMDNDSQDEIFKKSFDYAAKWVARYKDRIHVWELNNELDNYAMIKLGEADARGSIWRFGSPDGSSVDHYNPDRIAKAAALIRGLSEGVQSIDPNAKRIINSGGWKHYGFLKYLRSKNVDYEIIGWHWYSEMGDITNAKGDNVLAQLESFHKEIWITEGNFRSGSSFAKISGQADYLQKTLKQMKSLYPRVKAYFVYELFDEPHLGWWNHESNYGLVGVKMGKTSHQWEVDEPKPGFYAIQDVIQPLTTSTGK